MPEVNRKADFPIFSTHPKLVYLDSAATTQKPAAVISAVTDFYTKYNSNVHRGIYTLSQEATARYEEVRGKVAVFIGAQTASEIVFTGNASEAINLVAYGYARKRLNRGDVVVVSETEHHSNLVPWLRIKEEAGIELFFVPMTEQFELDYRKIPVLGEMKRRIKMVALTLVSNVLGTINPIRDISEWLKKQGIEAKLLVDAAQAVPHIPVNVAELGCDFLVFSAHKMLGPTGVGVLWGKRELLEETEPLMVGSHMIREVTTEKAIFADIPDKFETGTGRLEGVVGLGAAVDYLTRIGMKEVFRQEKELTEYMLEQLLKLDRIQIYGKQTAYGRLGVVAFNVVGVHPHDTGEILNRTQVCVRAGHHCAQPLMRRLGIAGSARTSLYLYNTKEDVDRLVTGIGEVVKIFQKNG